MKWALVAAALLMPAIAQAHDMAAASLTVRELSPGRAIATLDAATRGLAIELPQGCRADGPPTTAATGRSVVTTWLLACDLRGESLAVRFGDQDVDVLAHVTLADGTTVRGVLHRDAPTLQVSPRSPVLDYLTLGIEHILTGWDHMLFVVGLVLLVRTRRRIVTTLTAFTIGHSVTLAVATLGIVAFPVPPIEALIALSLVFLAMAKDEARGAHYALAFGLLHGLGFAGALSDIGLPAGDVPLSLLSFNIGVELGQLAIAFIAAVVIARAPRFAPRAATYAIGSLGVFWCLVRISQF